jgi:hypothetical protein
MNEIRIAPSPEKLIDFEMLFKVFRSLKNSFVKMAKHTGFWMLNFIWGLLNVAADPIEIVESSYFQVFKRICRTFFNSIAVLILFEFILFVFFVSIDLLLNLVFDRKIDFEQVLCSYCEIIDDITNQQVENRDEFISITTIPINCISENTIHEKASLDFNECSICTCDFLVGDTIRSLPCKHIFHSSW